ncbi:uncharacterized protein LOC143328769 isoform X1 [Chaetodon auriga]|uniref:uncharacterized protein LOC143328769 isoform X1 n=2 Tax=Chaetodon auriga TaxID=39042 RepID=UPI004032E146
MSKMSMDHGFLPLSSLRLIVPPLQLVSAALWGIVKQGAVMYYGLLEEFVSTVLETVPELLTYTERVQLVMGLRAKVVLELCRNDGFASPQAIQPHLSRINAYIMNQDKETCSSEVKASVANFLELVHTLVDDQCQRDIFYQKTFPTVFGPKYDSALQALMRKFLFNLQNLLPVPNLEQTSLWLSLSPSVLKECVDFMNQPESLHTLIRHHKHHGHKVPQALSSTAADCILSSLSYHLPDVDSEEGDALIKSGSLCVSDDWHRDSLDDSESKKDEEENFREIKSELLRNVGRNGEQHHDDLTEDQGASVEVILQPFDENESTDNDDDDGMDNKWFRPLKTDSRTSSKTFKCLVCGQDFGSLNKLKKHKTTHSVCFTNRMSQSNSVSQSSFFEMIHLHPRPKTNASRSAAELPPSPSVTTHDPSNLSRLPSLNRPNDDYSLVCRVCGRVFTYQKNFDKHQRTCVVRSKRQAKTDQQCSTGLAHHSKPNPADKIKECPPSDPETGPSNVPVPQESCKRSSRAKQCSVCRKTFTRSTDLMRHMRCHAEQSPYFCSYCGKDFDNHEDCETHQEGKCRVLNKLSQEDKSLSSAKGRNQENPVISGDTDQAPAITDAPAIQPCKSNLMCQECGQGFTYYKSFEKHQSKCVKVAPRRKKRTSVSHFVISGCSFRSADNTSSESVKTPVSANHADGSQTKARAIKCTMCEKNFSKIVLMKRHYSKSHKVRGSYPCPLCKRTFVRLCELVRHQQNKKLYQCAVCNKCYTKPGLDYHEKVHTASATPRICETCGKSFKCLAHLIMHQSKHKERQPSVCSFCGKQFSTRDCLKAHMVRHTGGYPCPVCGKKFYQKTYLKWHLYKHSGQEPYLCDTCGKGWPSAAQLKLHMIQHTEERPFKCDDCGVCYKRSSHLMAHRRAKHIRLRPFVCEVCSKAFRLNNELRKHMMVHTGERPFTCPRCGKTFTRKTRLREHREKACL